MRLLVDLALLFDRRRGHHADTHCEVSNPQVLRHQHATLAPVKVFAPTHIILVASMVLLENLFPEQYLESISYVTSLIVSPYM